ncbi:hypothetical protein DFS33DRAFT_1319676 [Desarmillaria ectypa]|nr:hypothetical protein DFS33DRAFT_1319676 [Desarmillaria ectypa]
MVRPLIFIGLAMRAGSYPSCMQSEPLLFLEGTHLTRYQVPAELLRGLLHRVHHLLTMRRCRCTSEPCYIKRH